MTRQCGTCSLCCRLLPVTSIGKGDNERCAHQRRTGCAIYDQRPHDCRLWSCLWLAGAPVGRPDRVGYVVDPMPDYVTVAETGERVSVMQVWVDPRRRDAHEDLALRAFIDASKIGAIVRFSARDAFPLFPPSVTGRGWVITESQVEASHSAADILQTIGASL